MAFEVKKINPLDLQPRKAVGLNIPFRSKDVFSSNYQTKDAIKNNLINFFLTGKGERYLNPMFGTRLRNMLFENINQDKIDEIESIDIENLKDDIKYEVNNLKDEVNEVLSNFESMTEGYTVSVKLNPPL